MSDIFQTIEVKMWIDSHWFITPMLTKGMAEQVVAIERGYTKDITEYVQ